MKADPDLAYLTPRPWGGRLAHPRYGTDDTYTRIAAYLGGLESVADWGGGAGHLRAFLPPTVTYTVIDGTYQGDDQVLADLATYREPSDGIAIRHVLEHVDDWRAVLRNALAAFRKRLVLVTFTPDSDETYVAKTKSGWPVRHFNPIDLRREMGALLINDDALRTSHPERIYYCERL